MAKAGIGLARHSVRMAMELRGSALTAKELQGSEVQNMAIAMIRVHIIEKIGKGLEKQNTETLRKRSDRSGSAKAKLGIATGKMCIEGNAKELT